MTPLLATAVRRVAWRLVPFLLLLYVLAFLDRVNIGFAKQAFLGDTGLGEGAYAFGASMFFVAYALFEIPSNLILHRVGARAWIGSTMMAWGVFSAAMMLVRSGPGFYALRFLVGAAEAGFFPGMIWYLSSWFPARNRPAMFGVFYFGAPLAQIFGGPVSGLLLDMNGRGGLRGWQWMFLVEGVLAIAAGAWSCAYLTSLPRDAHWLSPAERGALQGQLEAEAQAKGGGDDPSVLPILRKGRIWRLGIVYATTQLSFYGVTFYLPSEVSALLGRKIGLEVGLVSAIPWLCAFAAAYGVPRLAARTGRRAAVAALSMAVGAAGIAISSPHHPALGVAALGLAAAGLLGAQPVFWTFPADELAGRGAAGGIALINSIGAVGSFMGPNLKVLAESFIGSPRAGSLALAGVAVIGAVLLSLVRDQRRPAARG